MTQNFNNGKIYKITNDYNNDIYVGSTCDTLVKCFSCHRCKINCKRDGHRPLYTLMKEIGVDRFRIELIEDFPCEDKYQLRQKEGFWIRELGTLNKTIENRSRAEYVAVNREKILEYSKQYSKQNYAENKEILLEKLKETITCECGCVVNKSHLQRHKRSKKHLSLMT